MTRVEERRAKRASGTWRGSKATRVRGPEPTDPERELAELEPREPGNRAVRRLVNIRSLPEGKARPHRRPPAYAPRLGDQRAVVLHCVRKRGADGDVFAIGVALVYVGRVLLGGAIIVPDHIDEKTRANLDRWCRRHPIVTPSGRRPLELLTLSAFCDPYATIESSPLALYPTVYSGRAWLVAAGFDRVLPRLAEYVVERRGRTAGTWEVELWPCGTGERHPDGSVKAVSPHRPAIWLSTERVGARWRWAPGERGNGKQHEGRPYEGAGLDLLTAGYVLTDDRAATYAELREDLELGPAPLPSEGDVDTKTARELLDTAKGLHEMAMVVDELSSWLFTTPDERAEGRGRFDLLHARSPSRVGSDIFGRLGVTPIAEKPGGDNVEELHRWWHTFHGGLNFAAHDLLGVPVPAITADLSSCHPRVAHRIGLWRLLTAAGIRYADTTAKGLDLCRLVAADPTVLLGPELWPFAGRTRVELVPDGATLPVEIEDEHRADGRLERCPVWARDGLVMDYTLLDVLAACVLDRRVPGGIVRMVTTVPYGRQAGLRHRVPFLPGCVLDVDEDPFLALVELRRQRKAADDLVGAAFLRVVNNAMAFGNFARVDGEQRRTPRGWEWSERPGPWCFPGAASPVVAGSRLYLALAERMVADLGGRILYMDTDGVTVLATESGGPVRLPNGRTEHALSRSEVEGVFGAF